MCPDFKFKLVKLSNIFNAKTLKYFVCFFIVPQEQWLSQYLASDPLLFKIAKRVLLNISLKKFFKT